jgi:cutinase
MCARRVAAAFAAVAIVAGVGTAATAQGAGVWCPDVIFIGARGSGEKAEAATHGMGHTVNYMAEKVYRLIKDEGESMNYLPVVYSADSVGELAPSKAELAAWAVLPGPAALALYVKRHVLPYTASINDGVSQTIEEIELTRSGCPETEIILGGYSQGAMAVHQAELKMQKEGKDEALEYIGGTLLVGDGDRVPDAAARLIGGASRSGAGVRARLHAGLLHPRDVEEPETTAEVCLPDDIVCDFSPTAILDGSFAGVTKLVQIHGKYFYDRQDLLDDAVDFVAEEVGLLE